MNNSEFAKESDSGISLATIAAGIIAAVGFLLISSFVSNDATWPVNSANVWSARTLTGHEMAATRVGPPAVKAGDEEKTLETQYSNDEMAVPMQSTLQHKEAGHFYDALYSADFMSSFMEPT